MAKFSDSSYDILKTYFDILTAERSGTFDSTIQGQNHGIWANGGVYTVLYARNSDGNYIGHRFIITSIDGNNFRFGYHGRETVHGNATELEVGEPMYFRKDSFFHDWFRNNIDTYEDKINPDKFFLYFGPILSISGSPTEYNIEFYGMKDWVIKALPEHNQTAKLKEFMTVYWDQIHQEVYNMTKTLWSLIDPKEVNIKHIDYLATRANVSTDKDKFGGDELRTWVDNLLFWLKRKGTYTSYIIVAQMLLGNTKNKINIFEMWCEWCLRELRRSGNYLLPGDLNEHHVIEYYAPSAGVLPSGGAGDEYYEKYRTLDYPTHTDVAPTASCVTTRWQCGDVLNYKTWSEAGADDGNILTIGDYELEFDGFDPTAGDIYLYGSTTISGAQVGLSGGDGFRHCFKVYVDSQTTPSGGIIIWGASNSPDVPFVHGEAAGTKEWLGLSVERPTAGTDIVFKLWQHDVNPLYTQIATSSISFQVDTPYYIIVRQDNVLGPGNDILEAQIYSEYHRKAAEITGTPQTGETLQLVYDGSSQAEALPWGTYRYIYSCNYLKTVGGNPDSYSFYGSIEYLQESAGQLASIGPSGYPVISPHYRVELDLSSEPTGEDEIISQNKAEEITRYWDYLKPVSRFCTYNWLLSPIGRVDDIGQPIPLYAPDATGICDTTFVGSGALSATAPVFQGNNLIANPDMEQPLIGWANNGTPTTNERSSEQARSGLYSRKFVSDSVWDGIANTDNRFTVEVDKVYDWEVWVYPPSTYVGIFLRNGDNSGWAQSNLITDLIPNIWNRVIGQYQETTGGSQAYIAICSTPADTAGTWYIDDVSVMKNPLGFVTHYHRQLIGSPEWSITHGLNSDQLIAQSFDRTNTLFWPKYHEMENANVLRMDFTDAVRGKAYIAGLKTWNKQHVQNKPSSGWTIEHNLGASGAEGLIVEVVTSGATVRNMIPDSIQQVDEDTLQIGFSEAVTGRVFMRDEDYMHYQTELGTLWNIRHNLDVAGTIINCYDHNGYMIFPENVTLVDTNNTIVTFSDAVSGTAVAVGLRKAGDVGDQQVAGAFFDPNGVNGYWKIGDGAIDSFDAKLKGDLNSVLLSGSIDTRTETATGASGSLLINFEVPGWPRGDAYTINEIGLFDKNKNMQYYTRCSTLHKPDDVALNVRYRIRKSGYTNS